MAPTEVKTRIANLEAEIKLLKQTVSKQPDLAIDEINWQKIKPFIKKERSKFYKRLYG